MPDLKTEELERALEESLRRQFREFGLDRVELTTGRDHDGDPAIFVTAILRPRAPPMPGEISTAASVAVARVLSAAGEDRLSYLYIKRPDDERPLDELSPA